LLNARSGGSGLDVLKYLRSVSHARGRDRDDRVLATPAENGAAVEDFGAAAN